MSRVWRQLYGLVLLNGRCTLGAMLTVLAQIMPSIAELFLHWPCALVNDAL